MRGNISVISNYFQFGEAGEATGFSETMITSSNKGNLGNQFKALSGQLKVILACNPLALATVELLIVDFWLGGGGIYLSTGSPPPPQDYPAPKRGQPLNKGQFESFLNLVVH